MRLGPGEQISLFVSGQQSTVVAFAQKVQPFPGSNLYCGAFFYSGVAKLIDRSALHSEQCIKKLYHNRKKTSYTG